MSRKKSVRRKEKTKISQVSIVNNALETVSKDEGQTPPAAQPGTTAPPPATAPSASTTPPALPGPAAAPTAPVETPEDKLKKLAGAIFNGLMLNKLKLTKSFDNEHLSIIVYTYSDMFDDINPIPLDDVVCYEIIPKSNPNVTLFLDEETMSLSLNGHKVAATVDEITFAAANAISYIKKYYVEKAA